MNMISGWFNSQLMYSLGWTLLHSLWQAALIAIALAATLYITRRGSANSRYLLGLSALMLLVACSLATFAHYYQAIGEVVAQSQAEGTSSQPMPVLMSSLPWLVRLNIFLNQYMPQIVFAWLAGFALFFTRYCGAWYYCHRIKTALSSQAPGIWQERISTLARKIGVSQSVQLKLCKRVSVPCVIGHLRPVVLLPAALLTQLSQAEVEAILLHELGHIRRHDYVIGLIQSFIKTLYFFNLPVLWICAQIDRERENACDDIAANTCEDRVFYAHTLKNFSEISFKGGLAMAANGNNQHLLQRIQRLFESSSVKSRPTEGMFASALMIVAGLLLSIQAQTASADKLYPEIETLDDASVRSLMDEYKSRMSPPGDNTTGFLTSVDDLADFEALKSHEKQAFVEYLKAELWSDGFADLDRDSMWEHLNSEQWTELRRSWFDMNYSHFFEFLSGTQVPSERLVLEWPDAALIQVTLFDENRIEFSIPAQTVKAIASSNPLTRRQGRVIVAKTSGGDLVLGYALAEGISDEEMLAEVSLHQSKDLFSTKLQQDDVTEEVSLARDPRKFQIIISAEAFKGMIEQGESRLGHGLAGVRPTGSGGLEVVYEPEAGEAVSNVIMKYVPLENTTVVSEASKKGLTFEQQTAHFSEEMKALLYTEEQLDRFLISVELERGREIGEGVRRLHRNGVRKWRLEELVKSLEETGAPPEWMTMTKKFGEHRVIDNRAWVTIRSPQLPENAAVFDLELQEQPLREVVRTVAENQCTQTAFSPSYSQLEKSVTIYGYDLTCDKALEVFEALSVEQAAQAEL